QAEDGIRDKLVTGVQTCALPILNAAAERGMELDRQKREECGSWAIEWKNMATKEDLEKGEQHTLARHTDPVAQLLLGRSRCAERSEERRVGKSVDLGGGRGV